MDALLREMLPVTDIAGLKTPWACSAWSVRTRNTVVLEQGDLVHAIRASAAFPGMFQPVRIGDDLLLDGGISDRPGFSTLHEGERTLYHHLSTRSPWRRKGELTHPVVDSSITTLDLGAFRRLSPFSMSEGASVWNEARERTLRALDAPYVALGRQDLRA